MSEQTKLLDQPWEDVTITFRYQDGRKIPERAITLNRAEVEAEERKNLADQGADPAIVEAHELTPDEFQLRILGNAERMATSSIRVPGDAPHTFRILPPWAVREVEISVNNLASKIVLPRA